MKPNIFITRLYRKKTLKILAQKVVHLGPDAKVNINFFLISRIIIVTILFLFILIFSNYGFLLAPIVTFCFYFLYEYYYFDQRIKKRAKVLEKDAIFFFEVLALTLQSERNLKTCLVLTTNAIDSELSKEFKKTLEEVKLGKSLTQSLNDTKYRIPSETVNNVLLNVIESNIFGNSIVQSLNNQINYLTDKRILDIKGQINKLPTKISIISVLFFIPLIMLLILGPVLINYFLK